MLPKRIFPLLICASLLLSLVGCGVTYGTYITVGSFQNSTGNTDEMAYQKFDGWRATKINLKEGETGTVTVTVTSESGTLSFLASDGEKNVVCEKNDLETTEFSFPLNGAGDYEFRMTAENHKGSYKIIWDVKPAES